MPNHVINELVFRNVDRETQERILEKVRSETREIDFEKLLPAPLNIWKGSVGKRHEEAFPGNQLDWNRNNWGTKWNAYGLDEGKKYESIAQTDDTLTLTFQTAWNPPMGWIVAVFNYFGISFEHNYLSEDDDGGHADKFIAENRDKMFDESWIEAKADEQVHRHLHKLLWGVEEFKEEEEEREDEE